MPAEAVELVQGDTGLLPARGAATGGSASLQCAGTTLLRAADRLVENLKPRAAEALEAASEDIRYEDGSGQLLSGSLMDYALPRADDFPEFEMHEADIPTGNNPIGAKGAGELGCVGAPAAFMNAVADAAGTEEIDMPATPERVWRALRRR